MELADMLGLEPSAVRCAGSIPVPGKSKCLSLFPILNGMSSNGRTTDSESVYLGSNPSLAADDFAL